MCLRGPGDGLGDAPLAKPRASDVQRPSAGAAAVKLVECAGGELVL